VTESRPIAAETLKAYARAVFDALGGAMTAAMICLGDRLGLSARWRMARP
jgi:hypothetical protein